MPYTYFSVFNHIFIRWQITFSKLQRNVKMLGRRLYSPSWKDVAWLEGAQLKPSSQMPPTYLEHRYGIFEHLSQNHNLSQAGGCRRWKYFMWTSSADATYSSETIRSIFTGKMVENCAIRFAFRAYLRTSAIHRRCAGDTPGQIAERCQLQPTTTSQVGRRDMRTRLNFF